MLPATQQSNELVNTASWGTEGTSSKDLVIPKIQIAQAVSHACKEGLAKPGELLHSLTNEVLAPKSGKLEVLPILCIGSWVVSKLIPGGQPEFLRKEPLNSDNDSDNWKQEMFEDGQAIIKQKCLTFLVLLTKRANGFPFFIDFQKTNKNGGKLLSTVMQENKFLGKPAPARAVELSTSIRTFKNNSWFITNVSPGREATGEELASCKKWYDVFAKSQLKEDSFHDEDNGIS